MTERVRRATLLALLSGDQELLERLCDCGFVPAEETALGPEHAETARVVHTLVHELEVNWAGVEVILHLRTELVATRRQMADFMLLLRERLPRRDDS